MNAEHPHQMTFEEKFARTITPQPGIPEPLVWFQELYLMKRLGAGLNDETRIRNYSFQRGLNVLWAEPEDPEASAGLYRDGIAGHSTGKTLFCRILRHLLGEPNFGTSALCENVRKSFKELWAIALVQLDGKPWVVGRSLAGPGSDFAMEGTDLESVWTKSAPTEGFGLFESELKSKCGAPLAHIHPTDAWRHLIPWIARDQEARFSSIIAWRDSLSEADNPRTSAPAQHLVMRAVLTLLEKEEYDARMQISVFEDQIKGWNAKLPIELASATAHRRSLERTLLKIPTVSVDLTDLRAAQKHITGQRTIRQESLSHFQSLPECEEVQAARKALQDAISKKSRTEARIQVLAREIPEEKRQTDDQLLTIERIKTKGLRDGKRVADGFCPNSFLHAQGRECVPKNPTDGDSLAEINELEEQATRRAKSIEAKETEKARLESQFDQLNAAVDAQKAELSAVIAKNPTPVATIQKEITNLEAAETEIEDAISAGEAHSASAKKISAAQASIEKLREGLAGMKRDAEERLKLFSEIYADIIRAVLGTSVSASAELNERGINTQVKRNSELGGAALETIKTLAFDLAAVVHSMEGKGLHPRFLIHDGPREADMARVIYERFFVFARRMEECFPPGEASFQYIVTTTTHPPVDMQEGTPWLLGPRLSAKTREGRLLKADF